MISLGPATSCRRCHCCSKWQARQAQAFLFQQALAFLFQHAPAFLFKQAPAFLFKQAPAFLFKQAPKFLSKYGSWKILAKAWKGDSHCFFLNDDFKPFHTEFLEVQPTVSTLLLIVVEIRNSETWQGCCCDGQLSHTKFLEVQSTVSMLLLIVAAECCCNQKLGEFKRVLLQLETRSQRWCFIGKVAVAMGSFWLCCCGMVLIDNCVFHCTFLPILLLYISICMSLQILMPLYLARSNFNKKSLSWPTWTNGFLPCLVALLYKLTTPGMLAKDPEEKSRNSPILSCPGSSSGITALPLKTLAIHSYTTFHTPQNYTVLGRCSKTPETLWRKVS